MRELRFKKIDRGAVARHDREVRGLVDLVKASTPKGATGITPRMVLKTLFEFNRKASTSLMLIDGILAGDMGPVSDEKKAAFLALRPIFAAVVSVCPYKPRKTDDV